jgi:hypothetical protein
VLISYPDRDLIATFEGHYQPPDRLQGSFQVTGADFGFLNDAEIFVSGREAWAREPGGSWERRDFYSAVAPLVSPWFYVEALEFNTLRLSPSGSAETVNGVEAYPLSFDKGAILELMTQATEFTFDPDTMERTIDNAAGWLPDDFELEAWIAVDGSYLLRLEIAMSGGSDGFGLVQDAERVKLRIDITDLDVDIDLARPSSIPTHTPSPTPTATPTPSGELTEYQRARVAEIVALDPRVNELVRGGSIGLAHEAWHTSDLKILGGYTYVRFIELRSYQGSLPSIVYDETETTDPPFTEVERDVSLEGIKRLRVLVYLPDERVVQVEVVEQE